MSNETGSRKLIEAQRTGFMLLAAMAASLTAAKLGVDIDFIQTIFEWTVGGLGFKLGAFTFGNVKEHQAKQATPTQ